MTCDRCGTQIGVDRHFARRVWLHIGYPEPPNRHTLCPACVGQFRRWLQEGTK